MSVTKSQKLRPPLKKVQLRHGEIMIFMTFRGLKRGLTLGGLFIEGRSTCKGNCLFVLAKFDAFSVSFISKFILEK